jgi:hypothetical protein
MSASRPYLGANVMTEERTGSPDDLFSLDSPMAQRFFYEEADDAAKELQRRVREMSAAARREFVEAQSRFVMAVLQSPKFSDEVKKELLKLRVKLEQVELGKLEDKRASARLADVFASVNGDGSPRPTISTYNANKVAKGIFVLMGFAAILWSGKRLWDRGSLVDLQSLSNDGVKLFGTALENLFNTSRTTIVNAPPFLTAEYLEHDALIPGAPVNLEAFKKNFKLGDNPITDYCTVVNGGPVGDLGPSQRLSQFSVTNLSRAHFHVVGNDYYFDCYADLRKIPTGIWRDFVMPVFTKVQGLLESDAWEKGLLSFQDRSQASFMIGLRTSGAFLVALAAVSWQFSHDYMTELNDPRWSLYLMGTLSALFALAAWDFYQTVPVKGIIEFGMYASDSLYSILTQRAIAGALAVSPLRAFFAKLPGMDILGGTGVGMALSFFGAAAFTGIDVWSATANVKYDLATSLATFGTYFAQMLAAYVVYPAAKVCYKGTSSLIQSACSEYSPYLRYLEKRKLMNMTTEELIQADEEWNAKKGTASSARFALLECEGDIEAAAKLLVANGLAFSI